MGADELADEFRQFAKDMEETKKGVHGSMGKAARKTSESLSDLMKSYAPQGKSGKLRSSIGFDLKETTKRSITYSVGPDHAVCDYAKYVEFGTGMRGEAGHASGDSYYITPGGLDPETALAATSFEEKKELAEEYGALAWDGADHPVLVVEHPGVDSQKFFRPAVNWAEEDEWLTDALEEELEDLFEATHK